MYDLHILDFKIVGWSNGWLVNGHWSIMKTLSLAFFSSDDTLLTRRFFPLTEIDTYSRYHWLPWTLQPKMASTLTWSTARVVVLLFKQFKIARWRMVKRIFEQKDPVFQAFFGRQAGWCEDPRGVSDILLFSNYFLDIVKFMVHCKVCDFNHFKKVPWPYLCSEHALDLGSKLP